MANATYMGAGPPLWVRVKLETLWVWNRVPEWREAAAHATTSLRKAALTFQAMMIYDENN